MSAPEDWIGELVTVTVLDPAEPLVANLLEVNDRGIVIRVKMAISTEEPSESEGSEDLEVFEDLAQTFVPWPLIRLIHKDGPDAAA